MATLASCWRSTLADLLALQALTRSWGVPKGPELDAIDQLRRRLPAEIVAAFDSRTAAGRPTVAMIRQGACSVCRARVDLGPLFHPPFLATCPCCGCYLVHRPEEPSGAAARPGL